MKLKAEISIPSLEDTTGTDEALLELAKSLYFRGLIEVVRLPQLSTNRTLVIATINVEESYVLNPTNQTNRPTYPQGVNGQRDLKENKGRDSFDKLLPRPSEEEIKRWREQADKAQSKALTFPNPEALRKYLSDSSDDDGGAA